jgi:hypothetical protein
MSPVGTGLQRPARPGTLHEWQVPQVADVQQTPSRQLLLSHSGPLEHICPRRFLPHDPALQTLPGEQSASVPQALLQVVPLQAYDPHDSIWAGRQPPLPSQVRASVAVAVPAGHVGAAHCVPAP